MPDTESSQPITPPSRARFATTHWTVVLAAGSPDSSRYREALETLCRTYWFPLYAYLRRQGYSTHDAEDQTQAFLAHTLEKHDLVRADPNRGRFRSFLLSMLKHFVADQRDHAHAKKRGGDKKPLSFDVAEAEARYGLEPSRQLSPDVLFEKSWALTILNQTMVRLKAETSRRGKQDLFEHLKSHLAGQTHTIPYRDLAAELRMTEGAVKVAVHRFRARYRELLREEIAQTVSNSTDVEDEIRTLFAALAS